MSRGVIKTSAVNGLAIENVTSDGTVIRYRLKPLKESDLEILKTNLAARYNSDFYVNNPTIGVQEENGKSGSKNYPIH